MVILSAIGKFFKFLIKSVFKITMWILKGFLSPIGLLFRLLIIGAIVVGVILIF